MEAILDDSAPAAVPMPAGKFGMWVFLVSEIMFFTGLIGSYIVLRLGSSSWPNPLEVLNLPLLTVNTTVLLTSSLTMAMAVSSIYRGETKAAVWNLWLTIGLGVLFLVLKGVDYAHMIHNGFTISSSLFGSCYYLITAFHGLHVLSGIITLAVLAVKPNALRIECTGLYWHFIDIVWVVLFAFVCLL